MSSSSTSFAGSGRDLGHAAELRAAVLLDLEADELEGVVLALLGLGQLAPVDLDRVAARRLAVEPDHGTAAGALRLDDPRRLAADEQRRAFREALRVLARLLDDEGALEPVRLADLPDLDSHARDSK